AAAGAPGPPAAISTECWQTGRSRAAGPPVEHTTTSLHRQRRGAPRLVGYTTTSVHQQATGAPRRLANLPELPGDSTRVYAWPPQVLNSVRRQLGATKNSTTGIAVCQLFKSHETLPFQSQTPMTFPDSSYPIFGQKMSTLP